MFNFNFYLMPVWFTNASLFFCVITLYFFMLIFALSMQGQKPQSMFDRLMAEHHVSGQSLGKQHELPANELLSLFYDSIWENNLQPKREVEMLAVKIHRDKLFGLSPDGRLSSFDIHSSKVCWSIPTDIELYLDFSFKSSESNCSYFVDSSRVFIHTEETKPVVSKYNLIHYVLDVLMLYFLP